MTDRNHHIQALRAIAASLVVFDHACGPLIQNNVLPQWFDRVRFSIGGFGVYVFFVISGFIMISMSYGDFGRAAKSRSFIAKRIVRIVPTYWMATFLAFVIYSLLPLSQHPSLNNLLHSLTFIPYSVSPNLDMEPVLGQGWTLNYEMFFYALFALALLFPRRIGLMGLFLAFSGIVIAGAVYGKGLSNTLPATTALMFLADPMILLFAVGIAIGVLRHAGGSGLRIQYPLLITIYLVAAQVALLTWFRVPPRVPFPETVLTWLLAIAVVAVCACPAPGRRGMVARACEAVGDASYATYLFHIFIVYALSKIAQPTAATAALYVTVAIVLSTLFGLAFYRFVERPTTAFLRNVFITPAVPTHLVPQV